jgi:hypothetical protein
MRIASTAADTEVQAAVISARAEVPESVRR